MGRGAKGGKKHFEFFLYFRILVFFVVFWCFYPIFRRKMGTKSVFKLFLVKDGIFIGFTGAQRPGSGPSVWSLFSKVSILVFSEGKHRFLRILRPKEGVYCVSQGPGERRIEF